MSNKILLIVLFCIIPHIQAFSEDELKKIKSIVDQELKDQTEQFMKQTNDEKKREIKKDNFFETDLKNKIKNDVKDLSTHQSADTASKFPFNDVIIPTVKNTEKVKKKPSNKIDNCFDLYGEERCSVLHHDLGMPCDEERLSEFCEKTCRVCQPKNEDCKSSKFGCCESDGKTSKDGPDGFNCPECKDNHERLCEKFVDDCNMPSFAGSWMMNNCLKTCGVCTPVEEECEDVEEYCEEWKTAELCEPLKDMMKKNCKKTCGFCGKHKSNEKVVVIHE